MKAQPYLKAHAFSKAQRSVQCALLVCFVALTGCGDPPMQTVTGTVMLNGNPIEACKVGFFPDVEKFEPDRHGFGYGVSDAAGKFTIQHPQGDAGIWAGKYKVTFEAWVTKDKKPIDATAKPSEVPGGVTNLLPESYLAPSTTPERATVTSGANDFTFDLKPN